WVVWQRLNRGVAGERLGASSDRAANLGLQDYFARRVSRLICLGYGSAAGETTWFCGFATLKKGRRDGWLEAAGGVRYQRAVRPISAWRGWARLDTGLSFEGENSTPRG